MCPEQCRQARDILKWTRGELAAAAGVDHSVVDAFEDGRSILPAYEVAIRTSLEALGIGFPFELVNGRHSPAGVTYSPREREETN
jgi:DNA-binding XRE family transcriptional regulator